MNEVWNGDVPLVRSSRKTPPLYTGLSCEGTFCDGIHRIVLWDYFALCNGSSISRSSTDFDKVEMWNTVSALQKADGLLMQLCIRTLFRLPSGTNAWKLYLCIYVSKDFKLHSFLYNKDKFSFHWSFLVQNNIIVYSFKGINIL